MNQFIKLFKKVGGKQVLKQYWHARVLLFSLIETLLLGFSKKSLEIVRLAVNKKILDKLRKQYTGYINQYKADNSKILNRESNKSNYVWVCWLQGIENAPEIVKRCYASLEENIKGKEIILLTSENLSQYIQFPEYIIEKYNNAVICNAHFADLVRLEVLIKYGGTWIDSTVLCTSSNIPNYMLDSELFVFQNMKPGLDGQATRISNWFISAYSNNPILLLVRELLYEYWKKNNVVIDYYIFHDFFELAIEAYPDEWKKVIPFNNATPHILLINLFEEYNASLYNATIEQCCFHKLTYKFTEEKEKIKDTFYKFIITNERRG